ncbi:MAG: hypothetical protein HY822_02010, partial [Acidobacteria bacterium]|nr:hypothetical protein [Acidobacteriota bacterium]
MRAARFCRGVLLALAVALAGFGAPRTVPGICIVELQGEPGVERNVRRAVAEVRRAMEGRRPAVRRGQRDWIRRSGLNDRAILTTMDTIFNAVVVRVSPAERARLAGLPGVIGVYPVQEHVPTMDRAVVLHGVRAAWERMPAEARGGAGQKIGIIDSGIELTHPAFQDPDLRMPPGFPKVAREEDREFTTNKIIVARNY